MTTNRLSTGNGQAIFTSGMRACEWAALARSKGLMAQAEEWLRADREGWDQHHYCPLKAEKLQEIRRNNR